MTSFITETDKLKGLARKEKSKHLGRKNLSQPVKINELLLPIIEWLNLTNKIVSERSQTQRMHAVLFQHVVYF